MKKHMYLLIPFFTGVTFFASAQGMGLKLDNEAYKETPLIEKPMGFGENLPVSFSLKQYVPEIGNQGNHGTCTAWSSTYYIASMEYAIQAGITERSLITSLAYDPYMTYVNIITEEENEEKSCEFGTYPGDACERLMEYGAKRLIMDPFSCDSKSLTSNFSEETCVIDFTNYVRLFSMSYDWSGTARHVDSYDEVISSVCQSLVNKHPVLIGMDVMKSFFNIGSDGLFDASNGEQVSVGGHAMAVVGYDDNKHGGCFTVVNSWGEEWGEDGFLYITYDDFYKYVWYAFSLESEIKSITSAGCYSGDCDNNYGIMKYDTKKMKGTFEGYFSNGKMSKGIYTNLSGNVSSKELKMMQKTIKGKYYSKLLYDDAGNVVGFFLN